MSSSSVSSSSSFFEQVAIIKAGSTCIVGSAKDGLQWGLLASDFLLLKALQSSRFSKVLCINLDRNIEDLRLIAKLAGREDKLSIISWDYSMDPTELQLNIKNNLNTLTTTDCCVAIFYFSISEMVFEFGLRAVCRLLKDVGVEDSDVKDLKRKNVHCTIGVVHETLHSKATLHYLQSLFSTVCIVNPNDGTMSSAVLGQIQCIRKSPQTGKFYESIDFFTHANGVLFPIPPVKDSVLSKYADLDGQMDSTTSTVDVTSVLSEVEIHRHTESSAKVTQSSGGSSTVAIGTSSHSIEGFSDKRLIAFDSTDPEFDEDSDPDNDLDL